MTGKGFVKYTIIYSEKSDEIIKMLVKKAQKKII